VKLVSRLKLYGHRPGFASGETVVDPDRRSKKWRVRTIPGIGPCRRTLSGGFSLCPQEYHEEADGDTEDNGSDGAAPGPEH
jgi:hypothetical protein